ncbi:hypothetical protein DFS33DRAFT_1354019 [Desarmillaria ectypa]|nr:hypothetical protein DFS33DRAFT_1354019 [Desarmillaria ectypa]
MTKLRSVMCLVFLGFKPYNIHSRDHPLCLSHNSGSQLFLYRDKPTFMWPYGQCSFPGTGWFVIPLFTPAASPDG